MEDSGEKISITIEISPTGAWSSNRSNVLPGDHPRAIEALRSMMLNMSEAYASWEMQRIIVEAFGTKSGPKPT